MDEHKLTSEEAVTTLRNLQDWLYFSAMNGGTKLQREAIDIAIRALKSAQTAQHIDADGTLWITVTDIEQVKRVIVDEDKSKFCRQFYMDAQPEQRTGKWIKTARWGRVYYCNQCRNYLDFDGVNAGRGDARFCPNCGAKMKGCVE